MARTASPYPASRRWGWVVILLGGLWMSVGCNPSLITYFLLPFGDDGVPPKFKLASPDKEVSVALVATFAGADSRLDPVPVDGELCDRLAVQLSKRFKENKEKVKLIPNSQVRSYQNKIEGKSTWSPVEVGEKVKADYVIAMKIGKISLNEFKSPNLYRGKIDIAIKVYDVHKPEGEKEVFVEYYGTQYPKDHPIDVGDTPTAQFRMLFLTKVARDITKLFTSYPYDEKMDMD
jgi:hypothetical protein